mmetsp:Transcript_71194/g.141168  ORF Transcript_71194/g.141168 Transcript_71194/m.141168 type:complete len:232 (+) Transcript_71194:443-1138(+)
MEFSLDSTEDKQNDHGKAACTSKQSCRVKDGSRGSRNHERDDRQQAEEGKRSEHCCAILERLDRVALTRHRQGKLFCHHDVHEEVLVLGHLVDDNLRVLSGHTSRHKELDHLVDFPFWKVLQLPHLTITLLSHVVAVRTRREDLADPHAHRVCKDIGYTQSQHGNRHQVGSHRARKDRKRRQGAIKATEDDALQPSTALFVLLRCATHRLDAVSRPRRLNAARNVRVASGL